MSNHDCGCCDSENEIFNWQPRLSFRNNSMLNKTCDHIFTFNLHISGEFRTILTNSFDT